jgi:pimeloyl-ACP methyl ester carboxylesterase
VREHTAPGPDRPTVVLVHGYPDDQGTWAPLLAALPRERLHLVTYDVRGAGRSDAPQHRSGYRTSLLVDDLVAVLDAVLAPGARAHLVGHDWGSVQLWDAVAAESHDPRLRGRIASFTSISGPSLDHLAWLSRHPGGRGPALLGQLGHSWYVMAFQLPVLPELVWRLGHGRIRAIMAAAERLPADHWGPDLAGNAVRGLGLYRANARAGGRRRGPVRTDVPVLVVHPVHDRVLTRVTTEGLDVGCSDVRVVEVDAGHWVIATDPATVAALVTEHVDTHRT